MIMNKIIKSIVTITVINLPHAFDSFMMVHLASDTVKVDDHHLVLVSKRR